MSNRVTNRTVIPVNGDYDDGGMSGRGAVGTPPTSPITRVSVSVLTQQPSGLVTATPTTRTPQQAPLTSTNNNNYDEVCSVVFFVACGQSAQIQTDGTPSSKPDLHNTFVCRRVFIGKISNQ